ncbi:hypothetical protein [Phenylobacterium koreense]|uniref:3-methyladenine DNA glycosylase AlkD n=1 Tax=Phenylobacterium koreense TaxID=266125 RepID=A0ABV2ELX7_9CAUL
MTAKLELVLQRLAECGARPSYDGMARNLLHAYAACLAPAEICAAALRTLDAETYVRRAVRGRLVRLGEEKAALSELDALARQLLVISPRDARQRERIDTLLSHLYRYFGAATRQATLERWRDRGTAGSLSRWVKAIGDDEELFDTDQALAVWRSSGLHRASWLIAKQGDPERLADVLPELVEGGAKGWVVSRALLRAATVSEVVWLAVRSRFPATYAYACAKTGRDLTEAEALSLVQACDEGVLGDRGLAIWAVGQLGMIGVLERLAAAGIGILPTSEADESSATAPVEEDA